MALVKPLILYAAGVIAQLAAGDTVADWTTIVNKPTTLAGFGITDAQGLDATLTALAGLNATAGLVEQTGADVFTKRLIGVANATDIPTRADGDGRWEVLTNKSTNTALGTSNTLYPSQGAVKAYVDASFAANDAMIFRGVIDCSANPNYPAADKGDTYRVSVAGKIGGAAGPNVEIGDLLICITDGSAAGTHATVGANWTITQSNLDGAVIGPASVSAGNPAVFSGTTGKLIAQVTFAAFKASLAIAAADVSGLSAFATSTDLVNATGTLSNARIADNSLSPSRQAFAATSRVLGRITAGAGAGEELTGANIATIMGYTAADVLAKLLTVDGAGSGVDADLLDGQSSAFYQSASNLNAGSIPAARIANSTITLPMLANIANSTFLGNVSGGAAAPTVLTVAQAKTLLDYVPSDLVLTNPAENMLVNGNAEEGMAGWAAAGLGAFAVTTITTQQAEGLRAFDIDKGIDVSATDWARANQALLTTIEAGQTYEYSIRIKGSAASAAGIYVRINWTDTAGVFISSSDVYSSGALTTSWVRISGIVTAPATAYTANFEVWNYIPSTSRHLYADVIAFRRTIGTTRVEDNAITFVKQADLAQATIVGRAAGAGTGDPTALSAAQVATIITYTAADVLAKLLTVDGAGSGLDADLLDGQSSAYFLDLANATGNLLIGNVPNSLITYAKIQNVSATSRILGRVTAAAGVVEELTGAQVRSIAGAVALAGDTMTGALQVPAGLVSAPGLQLNDADTGFYQTAGQAHLTLDGVEAWRATATGLALGASFDPTEALHVRRTGVTAARIRLESESGAAIQLLRASADVTPPSSVSIKQRGTIASPGAIIQNDALFSFLAQGYDGATLRTAFEQLVSVIAATPSATDMESRMTVLLNAAGSVTRAEIIRLEHATGLSLFGANTVIDQNRNFRRRVYTLATLPTSVSGLEIQVSDLGGGAGPLIGDGTGWLHDGQGGYATVSSDANFTLTPLTSAPNIRYTATMTADRTVTLSTTNARPGSWFRISHTGSVNFNLNVGGLKSLIGGNWIVVVYDGSAWYNAQFGAGV